MENALSEGLSVAGNLRLINDFTTAVNSILRYLDLSPNVDDEQAMESDGKICPCFMFICTCIYLYWCSVIINYA